MLYTKTIEPGTFSLLKSLMGIPSLNNFSLVGGTALALRYGHRSSVDLDLFSDIKFDIAIIEKELLREFRNNFSYEIAPKNLGIFCYINNIKVDIVYFPHKPISAIEKEEGLRIYSSQDIAAMKIQAILGRGEKKDFWDLYELLQHYSLQQIIDFHRKKYPGQMLAISIPNAISYFVDADESKTPVSVNNQTWESIKKSIQLAVSNYLR